MPVDILVEATSRSIDRDASTLMPVVKTHTCEGLACTLVVLKCKFQIQVSYVLKRRDAQNLSCCSKNQGTCNFVGDYLLMNNADRNSVCNLFASFRQN